MYSNFSVSLSQFLGEQACDTVPGYIRTELETLRTDQWLPDAEENRRMGVARETTSSPYGNDGSTDLQMVTLRETHTHTHTQCLYKW